MTRIVSFEGSDYTGKTTTSEFLAEKLRKKYNVRFNDGVIYPTPASIAVCSTADDSNDLIKEILYTAAFLLDKVEDENADDTALIIQDRYWPSVIAYGRFLNHEKSIHAESRMNPLFIQPEAIVYLKCSYAEKIKRSKIRQKTSVLDRFLLNANGSVDKLEREIERSLQNLPNIVTIDTTDCPVEDVALQIEQYLLDKDLLK